MGNGRPPYDGTGRELDIAEIIFLVFTGLLVLFYFTDRDFRYDAECFYYFAYYSWHYYPFIVLIYIVNLFFLVSWIYGLYIRVFEIRITGAKLKMHDKLENYRNTEEKNNVIK